MQDEKWSRLSERTPGALKDEGYSPSLIKDPLYYFDPQKNSYYPLTSEVYGLIQQGKITF